MMEKVKKLYFYIGIPVIGLVFLFVHPKNANLFNILWCELIIIFGYIAAVLDIKTKKIPNNLILIMFAVWVITVMPNLFFNIDMAVVLIIDAMLGFLIGGGLFLLVYIISRKGLGGGDVKFMAATGLYTGSAGIMSVMFFGTIIAALTGLILILLKKIGRKDMIPLVPFLYVGVLITIFYK